MLYLIVYMCVCACENVCVHLLMLRTLAFLEEIDTLDDVSPPLLRGIRGRGL